MQKFLVQYMMNKLEIFRTCLVMRALAEHCLLEVFQLRAQTMRNARVIAEAEQLLEISRMQLEEMKLNNMYCNFSDPGTVELC